MAQQFEVQALGLNGIPYRIEIYNEGYGGATVTQLNGDQQFIRFEGGQRERVGIEPIWGKEVRINVRTNEDLSPLFGLEDRDAEVRVFRTDTSSLVWKGFILTDFFQDEPLTDLPGVELRAIDGLTTLEGDTFDALSGVSDSDIDDDESFISYTDLFTGILSTLYDSPLDVEFAVEWYPDAGGQLSSSDNPLRYSGARPDVYYDSEDGAWFDQQSALEDALKSQGLEIRQAVIGGELTWLVAQPTALSSGSVKTWRYAPDGTEDASSPFTRDLSLDLSSADTNRPTREFERRSESVSVTHNHTPIENIVGDDGYEEIGKGNASGWQIDNAATSYIDASILNHDNADASSVGTPDPTPSSLQQDTYVLEVRGSSQNNAVEYPISQDLGDISGIPPETALKFSHQLWHEPFEQQPSNGDQPHLYAELEVGGFYLTEFEAGVRQSVKGGSGTLPVQSLDRAIPNGTKLPLYNRTDSPPDQIPRAFITLSERADKGDTVLVGDISRDVDSKWAVAYLGFTSTAYDFALWRWTKNPNSWGRVEARAFAKDPSGQPLSGDATLRIGGAALYGETNAGNVVDRPAFVDDVTVQLTQQGNELTATTKKGSVSENGKSRDLSVLLSSGPTSENPRRVKGVGPSSNYQATDWGIGAGGGSLSLAGLQARERLRYLREHLERQQLTVYARDKSPVVTGEEIVQFDGKTWRIAEFSSDPYSGEIGLTLIQHADAGTTDLSIATVRDTEDGGTSGGGGTAPAVGGGGGGASTWDDLSGELSGPVPFDATDDDGNPTSRSLQFLNVTPQVDVTSDPANGIALEIKDQTNGTRLGTLTTDGRWETRADQEAFADGSFNSGQGTNSLLSVENSQGDVLTTDAASLQFTGSGVSVTEPNPDEIVVDVSGGSNVGSLSDLSDVSSAAQGDGSVLASDGTSYSEESVQSLFDAHVSLSASDVSGVSADSASNAHHSKTTTASELVDVSPDSDPDAHHAVFEPADYNPVSDVEAHGNALAIDITGDADTLDDVEGANYARSDQSDTINGQYQFSTTGEAAQFGDGSFSNTFVTIRDTPDNFGAAIGLDTTRNAGGDAGVFVWHANKAITFAPQTGGSFGASPEVAFTSSGAGFGGETTPSYALDVNGTAAATTLRLGDYTVEQDSSDGDLNFFHSGSKVLELTDGGILRAAGDVVAFGLSGGSGSGSTSGLQTDAPLTLDTTTDPETIGLSVGSGLTINSGTLEADGSVGVSSVFGRTGDVTASAGDYSHSQISGVSSDDHHTRYSDEEAQDAVGTIMSGSGAASVAYDDAANTITISATDTDTQLSDSEVQTAINNDADHGSTASHNYTDSASGLSDVSPDSDPDAHHAVFEPSDYSPVSDVEAHGNALAIDITGDADTLDGVEGSNYARTNITTESFSGNVVVGGGVQKDLLTIADNTASSDATVGIRWVDPTASDFGGRLYFDDTNSVMRFVGVSSGSEVDAWAVDRDNGQVGIGGIINPSYAVETAGDMKATGEVEAFLGSDRRLKTDLGALDSALDKVGALTGYGFDWRKGDSVQPHKRGETDVGLIAQEVESVLPEAVKTFTDGHSEGYKSVSYDKLVPLLVEAIKDLRSQVNNLQ